jgi:hypothetical protein
MDRVCLVRGMHHEMKNHNSATYYSLTGHAPPLDDIRLRDTRDLFPAYGSVVERLAPARPSPSLHPVASRALVTSTYAPKPSSPARCGPTRECCKLKDMTDEHVFQKCWKTA